MDTWIINTYVVFVFMFMLWGIVGTPQGPLGPKPYSNETKVLCVLICVSAPKPSTNETRCMIVVDPVRGLRSILGMPEVFLCLNLQ